MDGKGNLFSNGPNGSSSNGPVQVRHDWHCPCRWCVQGHK